MHWVYSISAKNLNGQYTTTDEWFGPKSMAKDEVIISPSTYMMSKETLRRRETAG